MGAPCDRFMGKKAHKQQAGTLTILDEIWRIQGGIAVDDFNDVRNS